MAFAIKYSADRSKNLAQNSIRKEGNMISRLEKFLRHEKLLDLHLTEVKPAILQNYYHFCRADGCNHNHAVRQARFIKAIMRDAHMNELIDRNHVEHDYRYKTQENSNYIFLSIEELERLQNYHFESRFLQKVADLFVFQCYTGFDYGDIYDFDFAKHVIVEQEKEIITHHRIKNEEKALVPFFEEAKAIWEKYEGKFPHFENQTFNRILKEIAQILGIRKHLTTKVGRKTFGNVMYRRGISLDVVKTMMGHKSIRTTEKYYVETMQIDRVLSETNRLQSPKKDLSNIRSFEAVKQKKA